MASPKPAILECLIGASLEPTQLATPTRCIMVNPVWVVRMVGRVTCCHGSPLRCYGTQASRGNFRMNARAFKKFAVTLAGCSAALSIVPAQAQSRQASLSDQSMADAAWRALTKADVDAAYRLLKDNHPAVTPEANDPAFVAALDRAYKKALLRADTVQTMDGYTATLREFANSMGDGHINSAAKYSNDDFYWAGIITAKRGSKWVVATEDKSIVGDDLTNSEIISCDEEPVEGVARRVLSFRSASGSEAGQIMRGGRLLLDDGNPFLHRPSTCSFDRGGVIKTIKLNWKKTDEPSLQKSYWKSAVGDAGFDVRRVGSGYWIGMGSLDSQVDAVIDQVNKSAADIRSASFVVVDVRGNGGGNDRYGVKLASALYGSAYVDAKVGSNEGVCPSAFRVSQANIAAVIAGIETFRKSGDADGASFYETALAKMRTAQAKGSTFSAPTTCSPSINKPVSNKSLMNSPVIILTDAGCFSSCINVVKDFRDFGAMQAGQITGDDTHYSESRDVMLPSGLSSFGLMMAMMPDAPARIGPFKPTIPYEGNMADTAALEAWLPRQVLRSPTPSY